MKIKGDEITDWCCEEMERKTRQPGKSISIDLQWKDHFLDTPHPRACKWGAPSGKSVSSETGMTGHSGFEMIPIDRCPWCDKEIIFE